MRRRVEVPATRSTPRDRRKRRQQLQQTRCCACLVVVVLAALVLVFAAGRISEFRQRHPPTSRASQTYLFPLELIAERREVYRYELVPLVLKLRDPQGHPLGPVKSPPVITAWFQDQPISTIGNLQKLQPRYRPATQDYAFSWPVPWMAAPGQYTFMARVRMDDPADWHWPFEKDPPKVLPGKEKPPPTPEGETYCTALATVTVRERKPPPFPAGSCIATWEMDFPTGPVPRPGGGIGDWRTIFEWCRFLGADTLLFRAAYTSSAAGPLSAEQPFTPLNLQATPQLAAEAHRHGLKFGAWAIAYETFPTHTNRGKPPYSFAQDISRSTGVIRALDFISLLDQPRRDDLASFARRMQADPHVDYVGFDYMRGDVGGWEMTEAFTRDMPVRLPANWGQMSQQQRWKFMATKIETEWQTDRDFYEMWNWWRAHLGAQNLAYILNRAQLTKPAFIFVLSWQHGAQHGQDPAMFTDAGASFLLPMLYQVDSQDAFEYLLRSWSEYMNPGVANLLPGDQVDDYWHQGHRGRVPAQPELLYQRILAAHKRMIPGDAPLGAFFHDISRAAVQGRLGPYPGTEWALAGAAAFSQVRQNWSVYPLAFGLTCPKTAGFGTALEPRVTIHNRSRVTVRDLEIKLESTRGVRASGAGRRDLANLAPGEKIEIPLGAIIETPDGTRANRFMVAVRVNWPAGEYGDKFRNDLPTTFVLMQYVQTSARKR